MRKTTWKTATALLVIVLSGLPGCTDSAPDPGTNRRHYGWFESGCHLPFELLQRVKHGVFQGRMPDVIVVPREPNYFGSFDVTSHSGPWDYLQEVPLAFYGPGFIRSRGAVRVGGSPTLADIAPTWAELLRIDFPKERPGEPLLEVLEPSDGRPEQPALIVTVVWDGGGWNALRRWPRAWPFLASLMNRGTSITNANVGSSPSDTASGHATMGTGAFAEDHGIAGIPITAEGGTVDSWEGTSPKNLEIPTLADLYDVATNNEALIATVAEKNWHLGMMGHGAFSSGGDHDIAALHAFRTEGFRTNPTWYAMPRYLAHVPGLEIDIRRVDAADGELDGRWGDISMKEDDEIVKSPAWLFFQNRAIDALLAREAFGEDPPADLLFVNYKPIDHIGHRPGVATPAMRSMLSFADEALRGLVGMLNRHVGSGRWAMVLTADHGMGPDPHEADAWPIGIQEVQDWIASHFGSTQDEMLDDEKPNGFWLNDSFVAKKGLSAEQVADLVLEYRLEDDAGDDIPPEYRHRRDEPLFSAAFPSAKFGRIWRCALRRRAGDR